MSPIKGSTADSRISSAASPGSTYPHSCLPARAYTSSMSTPVTASSTSTAISSKLTSVRTAFAMRSASFARSGRAFSIRRNTSAASSGFKCSSRIREPLDRAFLFLPLRILMVMLHSTNGSTRTQIEPCSRGSALSTRVCFPFAHRPHSRLHLKNTDIFSKRPARSDTDLFYQLVLPQWVPESCRCCDGGVDPQSHSCGKRASATRQAAQRQAQRARGGGRLHRCESSKHHLTLSRSRVMRSWRTWRIGHDQSLSAYECQNQTKDPRTIDPKPRPMETAALETRRGLVDLARFALSVKLCEGSLRPDPCHTDFGVIAHHKSILTLTALIVSSRLKPSTSQV